MKYILITPCKNEEKNIERLIFAVKNQTIKPSLWVIINDNSSDKTRELIIKHKVRWIALLDLKSNKVGLGLHIARVYRLGLAKALQITRIHKIPFSYIGILDGDRVPQKDYFEKLMLKMQKDNVGVASGTNYSKIKNKYKKEIHNSDLPRGGSTLFDLRCFIDIGGYQLSHSADSVANISAKLKGWKTKQYDDLICLQTRETSTRFGSWKGYKLVGQSYYYRDFHPLFIIIRFAYLFISKGIAGPAFLYGYLHGYIKKIGKMQDSPARNYYRYKKLKEIF